MNMPRQKEKPGIAPGFWLRNSRCRQCPWALDVFSRQLEFTIDLIQQILGLLRMAVQIELVGFSGPLDLVVGLRRSLCAAAIVGMARVTDIVGRCGAATVDATRVKPATQSAIPIFAMTYVLELRRAASTPGRVYRGRFAQSGISHRKIRLLPYLVIAARCAIHDRSLAPGLGK